jgi:hypothetical protein
LFHHTTREGLDELGARRPHVAADEDPIGSGEAGEPHAERVRHLGVELVRDGSPDVVGLDDRLEVAGAHRRGGGVG